MQHHRANRDRAVVGGGLHGVFDQRPPGGDARHERRHQHAAVDAAIDQRAHRAQALQRRGRARLETLPRVVVERRHAQIDGAAGRGGDRLQHVEVAHHHRPLGDDAHRRGRVAARHQAAASQRVGAFDRLIGISGGAEGHLFARPRPRRQLALQHLHEVGLHEDHRREVVTLAEFELMLIAPRKAVVAAVRASPIRIQRPLEWHALHAVQGRLAADLLVGGVVGARGGTGQRGDAAGLHEPGDIAGGGGGVGRTEEVGRWVRNHAVALFRFIFAMSTEGRTRAAGARASRRRRALRCASSRAAHRACRRA